MGDRICVMKDGEIMQVDKPLRIYREPRNRFVAGFIGSPPMNFFHGKIAGAGNELKFIEDHPQREGFTISLNERMSSLAKAYESQPVILGIRPEDMEESSQTNPSHLNSTITARTEVSEPMGSETYLYLNTGAHPFIARVQSGTRCKIGSTARLSLNLDNAHLFDTETELAIRADVSGIAYRRGEPQTS